MFACSVFHSRNTLHENIHRATLHANIHLLHANINLSARPCASQLCYCTIWICCPGANPWFRTEIAQRRQENAWLWRCGFVGSDIFVCELCGTSDAIMTSVLWHQQRSQIGRMGCHGACMMEVRTRGRSEGISRWCGCARALAPSMWCINCRVGSSRAALLLLGLFSP